MVSQPATLTDASTECIPSMPLDLKPATMSIRCIYTKPAVKNQNQVECTYYL